MSLNPAKLLRSQFREPVTAFGSSFEIVALPDRWRAVVVSSEPSTLSQEQLLDLSAQWSDTAHKRVIKYSDTGLVTQFDIEVPNVGPVGIVCKQGKVTRLAQRLGTYFKGPKEWREFWAGHQLRHLGLPTPLPLACMWRRVGFCHLEGRIITEFITDARSLDQVFRKMENRRVDMLLIKIVDLIGTLGQHALYHRDLKASNLLISNLKDDPKPWLIDLDGLAEEGRPFGGHFYKTLVRLVLSLSSRSVPSRTHCLRALRQLLLRQGTTPDQWKPAWREIQRGVEQLLQKRRGSRKDKLDRYE